MRDGLPEKAATEPMANGVRIRIGDADKTIAPGEHRYVIRYRTTRQIGRFADYDELYWNVTGNGWISRSTSPRRASACPRRSSSASARSTPARKARPRRRRGRRRAARRDPVPDDAAAGLVRRPDGRGGLAQGRGRGADRRHPRSLVAGRLRPAGRRRPGAARPARLLFHRLAARRPRSAPGDGGADLRPARRSQPGRHALRVEDGRRQSRLRGRAGRHGGQRPCPPGRGRRRLVLQATRPGIERMAGADPASGRGGSRAAQARARPANRSSWSRRTTSSSPPPKRRWMTS